MKNNIDEAQWDRFSRVARGAEQFSKHPSTIKQNSRRNDKKMTSALWSFFGSGVQDLCARIIKDNIGEPPWEYNFLVNLEESEYPKYLAKIFNYRTGEKLPLCFDFHKKAWVIDKKRCKTFNQKIQWIKLYGVTDLMRKCTDKVAVRDYVAEKIGEEYLKPALQIIGNCSPSTSGRGRGEGITLAENDVSTYFDQINWEKLPQAFVIKCNHGCKWQYIIKNKDMFLQNKRLFEIVKRNITGWLEQDYSFWGGLEMQYRTSLSAERNGYQDKGIEPKILIEPLMCNDLNNFPKEIHIYCFSGIPKYIIKLHNDKEITIYDENLNVMDDIFSYTDKKIKIEKDDLINRTFVFSKQLANDFKFVRLDWLIFQNKAYFEEMTFTPYSGFNNNLNPVFNEKLGELINL